MTNNERVDLAIWDVAGEFVGALAGSLTDRQSRSGPKIVVQTGVRRDRDVAIGSPRRVTAASRATLSEALSALFHAHRPRALLLLGPASADREARVTPGAIRVASRVSHAGGSDDPPPWPYANVAEPRAVFIEGATPRGPDEVGVDWAVAAVDAIDRLGAPALLVGVVTQIDGAGPLSRRPTLARAAGRWVGSLLSGNPVPKRPNPKPAPIVPLIDAVLGSI